MKCLFGFHEWVLHFSSIEPSDEFPNGSSRMQTRCLECGRLSKGIELNSPRYQMVHPKRRRSVECKKNVVSKFLKRTA